MKRMIVGLLEALSLIFAGVLLLVGFLIGQDMGQNFGAEIPGAIGGVIVALIVDILLFGTLFIFLEMNESLRKIVTILQSQSGGTRQPAMSVSPSRERDVTYHERTAAGTESVPRSRTMRPPSYPYSFEHKGKTVHHNNKIFVVDGKEFESASDAKKYVDESTQ